MNNHRETITGTTVRARRGARRTWWVSKWRAKSRERGTLKAEGWAPGAGAAQTPGQVLGDSSSALHAPSRKP